VHRTFAVCIQPYDVSYRASLLANGCWLLAVGCWLLANCVSLDRHGAKQPAHTVGLLGPWLLCRLLTHLIALD